MRGSSTISLMAATCDSSPPTLSQPMDPAPRSIGCTSPSSAAPADPAEGAPPWPIRAPPGPMTPRAEGSPRGGPPPPLEGSALGRSGPASSSRNSRGTTVAADGLSGWTEARSRRSDRCFLSSNSSEEALVELSRSPGWWGGGGRGVKGSGGGGGGGGGGGYPGHDVPHAAHRVKTASAAEDATGCGRRVRRQSSARAPQRDGSAAPASTVRLRDVGA